MRPPRGVPRDEWLLAIGLATPAPECPSGREIADMLFPGGDYTARGTNNSAAFEGAFDVIFGTHRGTDEGNPDAYAAGAGLAMALEES
jgi:hypothetical protein